VVAALPTPARRFSLLPLQPSRGLAGVAAASGLHEPALLRDCKGWVWTPKRSEPAWSPCALLRAFAAIR